MVDIVNHNQYILYKSVLHKALRLYTVYTNVCHNHELEIPYCQTDMEMVSYFSILRMRLIEY